MIQIIIYWVFPMLFFSFMVIPSLIPTWSKKNGFITIFSEPQSGQRDENEGLQFCKMFWKTERLIFILAKVNQ